MLYLKIASTACKLRMQCLAGLCWVSDSHISGRHSACGTGPAAFRMQWHQAKAASRHVRLLGRSQHHPVGFVCVSGELLPAPRPLRLPLLVQPEPLSDPFNYLPS